MHAFIISIIFVCVSSLENDDYDSVPQGVIVANIKRRDTIPLQPGNRRLLNDKNLNYRRTKDIREASVDRHFEITEALLRQAQREAQLSNSQINEMREDEMKPTQRQVDINDEIRDDTKDVIKDEAEVIDNRDYFRNDEGIDNELRKTGNKKIMANYDDKDRIDKVQREMTWLTIDTDDGAGINI